MAEKKYLLAFDGQAAESDFYDNVTSVTVEENTDVASTARLRLAIQVLDDGSWTMLDDDRLSLFRRLTVSIGVGSGGASGSMVTVFDGYVTGVEVTAASTPGSSFVDVVAFDTSVLLSLEEKIATWPNMSDSDIINQILGSYGVQAQVDTTSPVHQDNDTTVVQRSTDIQFARELASRNGLELYFTTDDTGQVTAMCCAPQLSGSPQPDLAIRFGGQSNLRSFAVRVSGRRPLHVKAAQIDVKSNSATTAQADDVSLAKLGDKDLETLAGGTLDGLVTPADAQAQMLILGPPTSDATELQAHAQAVRDEAGWFITAEGEINADAYGAVLRPHRLVLVKGAGTLYSGTYYVTRVVHRLQSDGSYAQTFEARRNARDLDGTEQFGQSAAAAQGM